ncbi:hypothetical protein BBFGKLBO_01024 [Synechococcus sp. CBW1107]|nr:hypothetical protein BBFGKLBO_01024 [Synechococcus sp. CBW1107]
MVFRLEGSLYDKSVTSRSLMHKSLAIWMGPFLS